MLVVSRVVGLAPHCAASVKIGASGHRVRYEQVDRLERYVEKGAPEAPK